MIIKFFTSDYNFPDQQGYVPTLPTIDQTLVVPTLVNK